MGTPVRVLNEPPPNDSQAFDPARPVLLPEYRLLLVLPRDGYVVLCACDSHAEALERAERVNNASDDDGATVECRYVTPWHPMPAKPKRKGKRRTSRGGANGQQRQ
jgi:hypothetical protein